MYVLCSAVIVWWVNVLGVSFPLLRSGVLRALNGSAARPRLITNRGSFDLSWSHVGAVISSSRRFFSSLTSPRCSPHAAGGLISGLCAATTSAPFDLAKTRVQNDSIGQYRGMLHCLATTVRSEGPMAVYKGWFALYLRLGPSIVVQVPLIEFGRELVGCTAFGVVD